MCAGVWLVLLRNSLTEKIKGIKVIKDCIQVIQSLIFAKVSIQKATRAISLRFYGFYKPRALKILIL